MFGVNLKLLSQSYRAYRKWVEVNGEEPLLPGLNMTHEQVNITTTSINIVVIANIISIIIIPILNPHRGDGFVNLHLHVGKVAIILSSPEINHVATYCLF